MHSKVSHGRIDATKFYKRNRSRLTIHYEHAVMERDLRITGTERGQSSNHQAPKGFDVSNPWKVWTTTRARNSCDSRVLIQSTGRETDVLGPNLQRLSSIISASSSVPRSLYIPSSASFLETSLYHTIEDISSFPPPPVVLPELLLELRSQSPNPMGLTLAKMHIKVPGQSLDPILFVAKHLKNLRLAADPPLNLFP